jgi:hypothetical protein
VPFEQASGQGELLGGSGAEAAVVANPGEAPRQDVEQEAPDELVAPERGASKLSGSAVAVAERHPAVLESLDARVQQATTTDGLQPSETGPRAAWRRPLVLCSKPLERSPPLIGVSVGQREPRLMRDAPPSTGAPWLLSGHADRWAQWPVSLLLLWKRGV